MIKSSKYNVKLKNILKVYELICESNIPITKKELSEKSNLSIMTVSKIIDSLYSLRIISTSLAASSGGRRPSKYFLSHSMYTLLIILHPDKYEAICVAFSGDIIAENYYYPSSGSFLDDNFREFIAEISAIYKRRKTLTRLSGLYLLKCPYDSHSHTSIAGASLSDFFDYKSIIYDYFSTKIYIESDISSLMVSEAMLEYGQNIVYCDFFSPKPFISIPDNDIPVTRSIGDIIFFRRKLSNIISESDNIMIRSSLELYLSHIKAVYPDKQIILCGGNYSSVLESLFSDTPEKINFVVFKSKPPISSAPAIARNKYVRKITAEKLHTDF